MLRTGCKACVAYHKRLTYNSASTENTVSASLATTRTSSCYFMYLYKCLLDVQSLVSKYFDLYNVKTFLRGSNSRKKKMSRPQNSVFDRKLVAYPQSKLSPSEDGSHSSSLTVSLNTTAMVSEHVPQQESSNYHTQGKRHNQVKQPVCCF